MTKRLLVPVFFTADENYAPYLSTALASLVDHVSKNNDYDVNVIYHNMKRSTMRKLEKIGKDVDNVNIILTEMQETLTGISDRKETRLKADCFTPTIYYRLFLPEMFPQYDKGIYLDSDIIVLGDVAELYKKELGKNNILAACTDMSTQGNELFCKYFEDAVGVRHDKYFNSGVLLMDFKKFRDEEFCEHFFYMLNKYDFDTVAPDQDYLNALCKDRVMYLDYEWNTMPSIITCFLSHGTMTVRSMKNTTGHTQTSLHLSAKLCVRKSPLRERVRRATRSVCAKCPSA